MMRDSNKKKIIHKSGQKTHQGVKSTNGSIIPSRLDSSIMSYVKYVACMSDS